jgi:hypothetical protein
MNDLKSITRRQLFTELFSKETLKNVFRVYKEFEDSETEAKTLSCEEAGFMLGRRAKKGIENLGIKL